MSGLVLAKLGVSIGGVFLTTWANLERAGAVVNATMVSFCTNRRPVYPKSLGTFVRCRLPRQVDAICALPKVSPFLIQ